MSDVILEMKNITKRFPGVIALEDVSFRVNKGEIRALVGENGAGKSTLMKILNGVYSADSGEIWMHGKRVMNKNPLEAQKNGLSIIYQEFNLVPSLSVAENIFIGRLKKGKKAIQWKDINKKAEELMHSLNYNIDVKEAVENLSVAEKQMIEITKALSIDAKVIIMDEPSAVLTENELKNLFDIVLDLKSKGITVIYISHRLEEIFQICDSVTVLRDGQIIDTSAVKDTTKQQLIEKMVGRKLEQEFPARDAVLGETVLKVSALNRGNKVKNVSFELRKGEILGLAGLVGAGRTETVRLLVGADKAVSGTVEIKGQKLHMKSPLEAKKNGIVLLPEDRKTQGLLLEMPITQNISVVGLEKVKNKFRLIGESIEKEEAQKYFKTLKIKAPSATQRVSFLSGGNQQKVVIAKWLFSGADILIFDEPTRGIDVGAKYEIYMVMNELAAQGKAIIMISSDMNEVVAMSDRVIVMHDGEIRGELEGAEINPEAVLKYAIE